MTPNFKLFLTVVAASSAFVLTNKCSAETVVTPYVSLGAYHRDCGITHETLCGSGEFGSDTPGTIDLGLRVETHKPQWFLLYADEVDIGYHHQSYVDRGRPFNDKDEVYIDMYGVRFTWKIESLQWKF